MKNLKKLDDFRLADWQDAAKANGVDFTDDTTISDLVSAIASVRGVDIEGKSKHAAKKAVHGSFETPDEKGGEKETESTEAPAKSSGKKNLEDLTVDELKAVGEKEGIATKDHNDKKYLIDLISSVRDIRANKAQKSKEKSDQRNEERKRKTNKSLLKTVDPEVSFSKFCANVSASFKKGIFVRRRPTKAEVEGHLDRSQHGYVLEVVEGKSKKDGKYLTIKTKIGKKTLTSDNILIAD